MKVDYHFHPNLYGKSKKRRLRQIWAAFQAHQIEAVICTEHVFKRPIEAYRKLIAAKPRGVRTHVFPGAELTTSEGIDIIAFAEHDWFDHHPSILAPYGMTLPEMLRYLRGSDLSYFIPHPTLLGSKLKRIFPTAEEMQHFLSSVPAYEAFNSSFLLLEHLCQYPPLRRILRPLRYRLRSSAQVMLPTCSPEFLAIGSDAHHPWEIGFCVEIPCTGTDSSTVFRSITNNTTVQTLHFPRFDRVLARVAAMVWTTMTEATMRRTCKKDLVGSEFLEDSLELHADIS